MVSETTNNILGAIGGIILAACLAPQLVRLYVTRSAKDISLAFLTLYTTGLLFMAVYLMFLDNALVAVISIFFELCIAILTVAAKIYLDRWGPHPSPQTIGRKHGKLGPHTLRSAVRTDISKLLQGTGGAPFPLIASESSHAAQHLLLDCTISLNKLNTTKSSSPRTPDMLSAAEAGQRPPIPPVLTADHQKSIDNDNTYGEDENALEVAVKLVEVALEGAGVEIDKRHFKKLSSFKSSSPVDLKNGGGGGGGGNDMSFIGCRDGYVTLIWYEESVTLAVDFLAAGEESAPAINTAAQEFGKRLLEKYPGSMVEASAVPRLRR